MGYECGEIVLPGDIIKWLWVGFKSRKHIRFLASMGQLLIGYEGGGNIFKWLKCGLKIRKNIRFLAYMDQLLMGYEDGEIVLPSGYKLA